jgi:nickel-dependent lactate racemase
MQVSVAFQDEQFALELPGDTLVESWLGPADVGVEDPTESTRTVLEHPLDFPSVRQIVVPGDRVAIALDRSLNGAGPVLRVLAEFLQDSGVEAGDVSVVSSAGSHSSMAGKVPAGMSLVEHDPADRARLAYLSTTKEGRRIYLNRSITDADVVIPVGRLGYDPVLGYCGPWSALFPGLSDQDTLTAYRHRLAIDPPDRIRPEPRLDEPFEVSWLLGSQFHVGVVPGGLVLAGLAEQVRAQGIRCVDRLWSFEAPASAECVVAGIGAPGIEVGIGELVEGLVTASRLVNHGGKIVALSGARGSIGPSLQRLIAAGDSRDAARALRGHDADFDSVEGRRLAHVLAWADVYLKSGLDRQIVEDLSMVPLDHINDVRRVVSRSGSCLVINRAELTRATVRGGSSA